MTYSIVLYTQVLKLYKLYRFKSHTKLKKIYISFFFRLSVALVYSPYYPDDFYFVNFLFSFILCNFNPVQTGGWLLRPYKALELNNIKTVKAMTTKFSDFS